jgi:Na+/H+ antiporter NhaC
VRFAAGILLVALALMLSYGFYWWAALLLVAAALLFGVGYLDMGRARSAAPRT